MAKIDTYTNYLIENKGSDLHLCTGVEPLIRINGELEKTGYNALSKDEIKTLLFEILTKEQQEAFLAEKELDFAYEIPDVARFRVNYFDQRKGMSAAFRLVPMKIKSIQEIGVPLQILKFTELSHGLVLVTGPTGCGKSTTLSVLIDYINRNRKLHIITIEDPIEFIYDNKSGLINQRELGTNTKSFAKAVRSALREDPDVMLVGEMRDLETIELAITAADTGHLVFATLHTNSAARTIDRIIDVFPAGQQSQIRTMLAGSLKGVICQQLLKRMDIPGRLPAMEILFCNVAVSNLIRENKVHQIYSLMQAGKAQGMQLMDDAIMYYLNQKKISHEEAYLKAVDKKLFEDVLKTVYHKHTLSH